MSRYEKLEGDIKVNMVYLPAEDNIPEDDRLVGMLEVGVANMFISDDTGAICVIYSNGKEIRKDMILETETIGQLNDLLASLQEEYEEGEMFIND